MNYWKLQFILLNENTGELEILSLNQILDKLNRDRSDEWIDYDKTDFVEGLSMFTDYKLIGIEG